LSATSSMLRIITVIEFPYLTYGSSRAALGPS
jgi:hypothetical protein